MAGGWRIRAYGPCTMRFAGTAKVLAECKLKYYRISGFMIAADAIKVLLIQVIDKTESESLKAHGGWLVQQTVMGELYGITKASIISIQLEGKVRLRRCMQMYQIAVSSANLFQQRLSDKGTGLPSLVAATEYAWLLQTCSSRHPFAASADCQLHATEQAFWRPLHW